MPAAQGFQSLKKGMVIDMKFIIKRSILLLMVTCLLMLTGCDKFKFGVFDASEEDKVHSQVSEETDSKDNDDNISTDKSESKEQEKDKENKVTSDKSNPTPTSIQPNVNIDLHIYTVNNTTAEIEPITALIPQDSDITPELIVDTVVESLADQSIIIKIDKVTTEDDKVIVSFKKEKAPYSDMGSGYEGAILDAIAQSLIDNLKDYKKVIYRIENKPYVSGVFEYGINEAHLGDN